jgi:hypothetical protein
VKLLPITIVDAPGLALAPCDDRTGPCGTNGCGGGCCTVRASSGETFAAFGGRDDFDFGGRDDRAILLSPAPTCITGVAAIPAVEVSSLGALI